MRLIRFFRALRTRCSAWYNQRTKSSAKEMSMLYRMRECILLLILGFLEDLTRESADILQNKNPTLFVSDAERTVRRL